MTLIFYTTIPQEELKTRLFDIIVNCFFKNKMEKGNDMGLVEDLLDSALYLCF